jgi:hypothetical protein
MRKKISVGLVGVAVGVSLWSEIGSKGKETVQEAARPEKSKPRVWPWLLISLLCDLNKSLSLFEPLCHEWISSINSPGLPGSVGQGAGSLPLNRRQGWAERDPYLSWILGTARALICVDIPLSLGAGCGI